jgi:hypothetical protein
MCSLGFASFLVCYHIQEFLPSQSHFVAYAAMVVTCVMLTFIHKRHRLERYKEVREYYYEQIRFACFRLFLIIGTFEMNGFSGSLRRSIIALHFAAADQYGHDEKQYYGH